MRNNKQHSSHSHHNNGNMDHSKHDHNEMKHSQMDHSEMDHGAMGGHAHHHHGSFKDIFLSPKSSVKIQKTFFILCKPYISDDLVFLPNNG